MADSLPNKLYSCEQTRQLDQKAIAQHGIAGLTLMKRAGRVAYEHALRLWPNNTRWLVFCGAGNNAGDGYVFAALAAQRHHEVTVISVIDPERLRGDAYKAYQYAVQEGVAVTRFEEGQVPLPASPVVIVDGLLGTGLRGPVREAFVPAIAWIERAQMPVMALDIPSGLCGDTGSVSGVAIKASVTVTFIGCKPGLLTGRGPAHTGKLLFSDLNVPAQVYQNVPEVARQPQREALWQCLPVREVDAHKGQFGHVMVVGGDRGFGGAAIMAAECAAYTGAGLISLATHPDHLTAALVRRPELMVLGVPSGQELELHLQRPTVLVVGPGLGQTPWSEQMLQQVLATELPLVIDADGLNILAKGRLVLPDRRANWILTPHPGEAARMLGVSTREIEQDRLWAAKQLQQRYGGVVLLKGAGVVLYDGSSTVIAKVGNPGLATGGTGDVLSGLIGGLLAQGLHLFDAAQLAVCAHGDAADLAVEAGTERGLLASELIPYIRQVLG